MDRKPLTLTLTDTEADVYDNGGDDARFAMAREYRAMVRELFAAGNVSWIEVNHPDGFTAWYFDRSPLECDDPV
jgi:hypothetical protein